MFEGFCKQKSPPRHTFRVTNVADRESILQRYLPMIEASGSQSAVFAEFI